MSFIVNSSEGGGNTRAREVKTVPRHKRLSLYREVPSEEITLDEFELFALDRLQLLRGIEKLNMKNLTKSDFNRELNALEMKCINLFSTRSDVLPSNRTPEQRKDQISHYILRLAYCRTDELRRIFLAQECFLLRWRLNVLSRDEQDKFLALNGFQYDQVSVEDKNALRDKLVGLCDVKRENFDATKFYRVDFTSVLREVSRREVYLEKGFAFIPSDKLVNTVVTHFRKDLSRSLTAAAQLFSHVSGDTRIGPLLKNMHKQYVGKDYSNTAGSVDKLTPGAVDAAAELHMPLCMKNLHNNLKREHKLKHWGRLQYGLFLKGAGLELEDAVAFWESHFTKLISHDNFQKQYAYNFRHMYGKEGARKNYTPYSCMKIIMGAPPEPGAYHGCPYRHSSDQQLASQLQGLKLSSPDVKEILRLSKSGDYQIACQRHFDATHPGHLSMALGDSDGAVSNHPNLWYQTSVKYHRAKSGKKAGVASSTATTSDTTSKAATSNNDEEGGKMEVE